MNAKTCALCVLILVSALTVSAAEIPGGVVASNGKDAIYYDFATKERVNLTADLKDAVVSGPFAASEDGKTLIWLQDSKFRIRQLPNGKDRVLKRKFHITKLGHDVKKREEDYVRSHATLKSDNNGFEPRYSVDIRNLTISPAATQISFECEARGDSWTKVPPGSPLDKNWLSRGFDPSVRLPHVNLPMYVKGIDFCNTVMIFDIENKLFINALSPLIGGNTAKFPGHLPCRGTYEDLNLPLPTWNLKPVPVLGDTWFAAPLAGRLELTRAEALKRFSFKRNAHFGAWSKNNEFFALIYQTPYGWGPIEIHVPATKLHAPGHKPGIYEITLQLKNCEGLAFKPDGSITYLLEEKLFSLDGSQIRQGIAGSDIAKHRDRDPNRGIVLIPVNNVFQIEPAEIAYGIRVSKLYWTSDYVFIFRKKEDNDHGLYAYDIRDRTSRQILYSIPENFFYCWAHPHQGVKFAESPADSAAPLSFSAVSGRNRIVKEENKRETVFEVGISYVHWRTNDGKSVYIRPEQKEFALLNESSIAGIKDPSIYEYQVLPIKTKGQKPQYDIKVFLNQILLLKDNNAYTAILPLELEPLYRSVDEMPQHMQKNWGKLIPNGHPPPFWKAMIYEWKFWPSSLAPNKLAKGEPAETVFNSK